MSLDDVYRAIAGTPAPATGPGGVLPQTRMVEPLGQEGHLGHSMQRASRNDVTLMEVDVLLNALAEVGRDLDSEFSGKLRDRLIIMSRKARAEVVARIDDIFEREVDNSIATAKADCFLMRLDNGLAMI